MHYGLAFLFTSLIVFVQAQASEPIALKENVTVYGYYKTDLPKELWQDACDKYIFANEQFYPLKNGKYVVASGEEIIADNNCLYTQAGKALLKNNDEVEFYLADSFNTEGNLVFRIGKNGPQRVVNEKLILKDGQVFSVENGYISDYGTFQDGHITYENRD